MSRGWMDECLWINVANIKQSFSCLLLWSANHGWVIYYLSGREKRAVYSTKVSVTTTAWEKHFLIDFPPSLPFSQCVSEAVFLKIKVLLYGHELMRRFENVYLRRDKKCQKERRKKRVALQLYFWIMSIKLLTILWKVQGCTSIVKTNETIWLFFFCEWKEDRLLVELNKVISWKGFMGEICLKSSSQVKINIGVEVCWQKLIENEIGN